ncbi:hypothetical protein HBE96_10755 [Clostridium sp. P21]|uniref:Uncharacterized protein n=1 Tax=Clostridium muellerianum TaxID=2716538 RepID=A0A7Y0HPY1_9CLOT|nr:hypothetical protein [Clostridium muellerianum]NMM63168.1 hypothetical protein [Clostridium muellerianum]
MKTDICCAGTLELLNEVSVPAQHVSAGIQLNVSSVTCMNRFVFGS